MALCTECGDSFSKLRYKAKCNSCWKKQDYILNRTKILKQKQDYHMKNKLSIINSIAYTYIF